MNGMQKKLKDCLNMSNYNGLILAAGRGSRMGKSTEKSHKCLTPLFDIK